MVSTPRWKVRRATAQLLGDGITLKATEDAPDFNPALFVDARNLAIDAVRPINWQGVVVHATDTSNLWFRTRVDSANRSNRTITVDPEFPAYIRGGDQMDVFMHRGTGWRIEEYDDAINEAIAQLGRRHAKEVNVISAATYDPYSATIPLPDGWIGAFAVEYQFSTGGWQEINLPFDIDRVDRLIRVDPFDAFLLQNRPIRLWGYEAYPELDADDDETDVPIGYLKYTAASMLLISGSHRQVERDTENKGLYYANRGQELLAQINRPRSNLVWVG